MANITYRNVPYDVDGPGKVIIRDSWPQWQKDVWLDALKNYVPDPSPYVPGFITATITGDAGNGTKIVQEIFPGESESFHSFFATEQTAKDLSTRYGNGEVVELPSPFAAGGPVVVEPATAWGIVLKDGRTFNAGVIASYFVRNTEESTPGVADVLIGKLLGV